VLAAIFQAPEHPLNLSTVAEPVPGPREMLVRVERCGICASDLHLTEASAGAMGFETPRVIGHEYAGQVVALGSSVSEWSIGDRVVGFPFIGCESCEACRTGRTVWCAKSHPIGGAYAQFTLAPAKGSVPLPPKMSYEEGSLVEPMAVGLRGTRVVSLSPTSKVLVLGAGTIGLSVTHWATRFGVEQVVVMARSAWRSGLARSMGASAYIQSSNGNSDAVSAALGGAPDVVFECTGHPDSLSRAIELAALHGTVVSLGFGVTPSPIVAALAAYKDLTLRFTIGYLESEFAETAEAIASGDISPLPLVTSTIALADLPQVFESLRSGPSQCKVMVDPWH
jgi:2-desacetyl-2-hydroxyethyl bacteriochlorophyllide A dehydrogenase